MKKPDSLIQKMLVLTSIFFLAGCALTPVKTIPPDTPRFFRTDFDRVWNAAVDTLDERGYVIAQMSKEDGYITTELKDSGTGRIKLSKAFQGR